jgi:hypothetical protein
MTSFVEPQPANIRECWGEVKEGLESILKEIPQLSFLPEDVYSECVNGRAHLFTSPIGFVILTTEIDQFTGEKTLLIWLAYVYEKGKHNWFSHVKWFEDLAKNAGCKYLEARSPIPQLEEYFTACGWSLDTKVFTREVK